MWSTMSLTIGETDNTNQVDIGVFCGWETASSQIRICIVLSAIYTTFLAYRSVINESYSLADRVSIFLILFVCIQFLNSSQLFVFLMCITGLFDFLSIYDSVNDNYGLCEDTELKDYQIHSTLKSFQIKCATGTFSLTGLMMIISSAFIYFASQTMKKYRAYISIDNL